MELKISDLQYNFVADKRLQTQLYYNLYNISYKMHTYTVRPWKRRPINQVIFSENYDLSKKVYIGI